MSQHSEKSPGYQKFQRAERERCRQTKGKCWICHKLINCDLEKPDPQSFTLDHEPPMEVKLKQGEKRRTHWAHWRCNSRRGNGTNKAVIITTRKW